MPPSKDAKETDKFRRDVATLTSQAILKCPGLLLTAVQERTDIPR